jgi:hypothetical protein
MVKWTLRKPFVWPACAILGRPTTLHSIFFLWNFRNSKTHTCKVLQHLRKYKKNHNIISELKILSSTWFQKTQNFLKFYPSSFAQWNNVIFQSATVDSRKYCSLISVPCNNNGFGSPYCCLQFLVSHICYTKKTSTTLPQPWYNSSTSKTLICTSIPNIP